MVVTTLQRTSAMETQNYTVEEYTYGIPSGSLHMAPSLLPFLMDSSSEGLAPDVPPCLAADGDGGARQGLQQNSLEQKYHNL